ncbi:MAG: hypothetical protein IPO66_16430 [Rhodanobacteraceae bacterium]|nr:hypothetical protein [Rhodanobacteraceae bacterium]
MATDPSLISFEHFVEAYRQHMSSLPGHTEVKIDATTRTLRYRFAGQVHGLDLTRAYADFGAGDRSLAAFIEARANSLPSRQSEGPRSLEEAGSRLLPMIRDRRYLGLAVLMAQVSAPTAEVPALPFRELAGELVVTLALDSETTIQTLAEADLAAWGVDFDTACERAIANLRRRGLPAMEELAPGLYGSRGGDPYAVSCLLLPELTSSLPLRGEGHRQPSGFRPVAAGRLAGFCRAGGAGTADGQCHRRGPPSALGPVDPAQCAGLGHG